MNPYFPQMEACKGDVVKDFWPRYYSIQEARSSEYGSKSNGKEMSDYNKSVYQETFKKNEIYAKPDETRYFK